MTGLCFGEFRSSRGSPSDPQQPPLTLRSAQLHPGGEALVGISERGSVVVFDAREGQGGPGKESTLSSASARECWVQLASPGTQSPLRGATLAAWMTGDTDPDGLFLCSGSRLLYTRRIPPRESTCESLFLVAQHTGA